MLKCSYLFECWMCDDGDSVWGGRIVQYLHIFLSFSDYSDINMCFSITVGPNNITLGCCSNGTKYVSRNWVHWSRLIHPECNITNSTVIVNSIEDGGDGWDWDAVLLLVFILLFMLFGIIGMWRRRRRRSCVGRREDRVEIEEEEGEGGVEMKTTV